MITKFKLFEQKEQNWKLLLDISKIWKDSLYENANELLSFNEQYINFLNEQKNLIIKQTSEDAWNKLQELVTKLSENKNDITASSSIWDDIYDWADGNLVQIKVQQEELEKDF
jgi:hypothetical protein